MLMYTPNITLSKIGPMKRLVAYLQLGKDVALDEVVIDFIRSHEGIFVVLVLRIEESGQGLERTPISESNACKTRFLYMMEFEEDSVCS